jgi:hypothetical protein
MVMVTFVPQQASTAVGGSKVQVEPHWAVLLVPHVSAGGVVSRSMTLWLQIAVFEQQSLAIQYRTYTFRQGLAKMVWLLRTKTATFEPQHGSKAVGVSNVQPEPHSTVFGPAHVMIGGLVAMTLTTLVQKAAFEQQSTACQIRVTKALHGIGPLVIALRSETVTFVPQQASKAVGGVGCQPFVPLAPQTTTWLLAQVITGGVVSMILMKLVQKELLPQQSVAFHTAEMVCWQVPAILVERLPSDTCTFEPQQASTAVGGINVHVLPHCTI